MSRYKRAFIERMGLGQPQKQNTLHRTPAEQLAAIPAPAGYQLAVCGAPMTEERLEAIRYEVWLEFNSTTLEGPIEEVFALARLALTGNCE